MQGADDPFRAQRDSMLEQQLRTRGIHDSRVLDAIRAVPREEFVPDTLRGEAYRDSPLPIGEDQTISQPYIVAYMTQLLHLTGRERVLEVGTGSGYQTAILCRLCRHVYSLERYHRLASRAADTLARLNYDNVDIHVGDGSQGLPDMAPFDSIIVTAAAPSIPGPLRSQMSAFAGRMIIPVGAKDAQYLELVVRRGDQWDIRRSGSVKFVPLIGRYGFRPDNPDAPDTPDAAET
jgi:protein-L-isoaspartate(D-aspartate) O-methyltransferase